MNTTRTTDRTATTTATMDQIASIFGSLPASWPYLTALKAAGAPITVDTCHWVMVAGTSQAHVAAQPDFHYQGGSRIFGLL